MGKDFMAKQKCSDSVGTPLMLKTDTEHLRKITGNSKE